MCSPGSRRCSRRRGFNIDSLAVGPTEHPDVSPHDDRGQLEDLPLEQVTKQLNKLINVLKVVELDETASVVSASCCWSRSGPTARSRWSARRCSRPSQLFRAKVVDVATDAVTIEATGAPDKLEALIQVLEPYGIRELVQSGMVAIARGARSITSGNDRGLRSTECVS